VKREAHLGPTFVELADTLVGDFDVVDFLHTLTTRCVDLLEVDAAGLMLADASGTLRVIASSTEQVRLLELFEIQNQEGPCLDSYLSGEIIVEDDLDSAERWPRFRPEALEAGFMAVAAVPLRLRDERIGALNLFRSTPGRLDETESSICQALADVATIGLLQERAVREALVLADQLQTALNNRVIIEQAKGVLAERSQLDMGAAFERLRKYARNHNRRLADVAEALIAGRLSAADLVDGS
jgi:GAF domain-containing protein